MPSARSAGTPSTGRKAEDKLGNDSRALRDMPASNVKPGPATAALPTVKESKSSEYPLALLVSRALYDNGQMVSRSPELKGVTPQPFVELHPDEAGGRGLSDGQEVSVSSPRGTVRVRLRISEDTPTGAAYMLFDQPGVRANLLMDFEREVDFVEVAT